MKKRSSLEAWIDTGYLLFAEEGPDGIQIERLSRMTKLNKSGFYHYFGDREIYLERLMEKHFNYGVAFRDEMNKVVHFDPEFIQVLIAFPDTLLFHYQLVRNKHVPLLLNTYLKINEMVDPVNIRLFAAFIGINNQMEFTGKYYSQVRDMFYLQLTRDRLNYPHLKTFMYDARDIILNAMTLAEKEKTSAAALDARG
jgi:AcrR family transcriptional regulator